MVEKQVIEQLQIAGLRGQVLAGDGELGFANAAEDGLEPLVGGEDEHGVGKQQDGGRGHSRQDGKGIAELRVAWHVTKRVRASVGTSSRNSPSGDGRWIAAGARRG